MNTNEEALTAFDTWFEALDQNDTFAPVKDSKVKFMLGKAIEIASESEYVSDDDSDDEPIKKKKDVCRNLKRCGSGPLEKMLNSKTATSVVTERGKMNLGTTLQFSKTRRVSLVKKQEEKDKSEDRRKSIFSSLDKFLDAAAPSPSGSSVSDTKSCTDSSSSRMSRLSKTSPRTSRSSQKSERPPTSPWQSPRSKSAPGSHLSQNSSRQGPRKSKLAGALPPMSPSPRKTSKAAVVISSRRHSADDIKTKDSLSRSEHGSRRRAASSSADDTKTKDSLSRSEHGSRHRADSSSADGIRTRDSLSGSEHGSRRRASMEHIGNRSAIDNLSRSEHGANLSRRRASDSKIEKRSTKDSNSTVDHVASACRRRKDDLAQSEHGMGVSRRRKDDLAQSEHGGIGVSRRRKDDLAQSEHCMGVSRRRKDDLAQSEHGMGVSRRRKRDLSRIEQGGEVNTPRRTRVSPYSSQHGSEKHPTACQDVESAANKENSSESEHVKRSSHRPARRRSSQEDPDIKKRPSDGDGQSRRTANSSRTGDEEQSGQSSTSSQSTSGGEPLEPTSRRPRERSHDAPSHQSCGAQSIISSGGSICSAGLDPMGSNKEGRPRSRSKEGRPRSSNKEGRPKSSSKEGRPRSSSKEGRPRSSLSSNKTKPSDCGKDRTSRQMKKGGKDALISRGKNPQDG